MTISRRRFLTYLGLGTYAALVNPAARADKAAFPSRRRKGVPPDFFQPIAPSSRDELILPPGYRYDVVCAWGDPLGSKDPEGRPEHFGFNNDFVEFLPIDALQGGNNRREGLLWVNHEYPNPLFISKWPGKGPRTAEQVIAEKRSVGASVLHVRRENGRWKHLPGSRYNRRLTALYPTMEVTGPAASVVPRATGTLANCSGGRTPWHTVLTCEENYADANQTEPGGWAWSLVAGQEVDEDQYGWIVEVDPFGELPPRKHSALGRFSHENAALRLGPTGRLVIYMGDDDNDQFLYKFVSAAPYNPRTPRADQYKLLTEGTLYAADFEKGRWLPLDLRVPRSKKYLEEEGYKTPAKVIMYTRDAAATLGATPLDRPEVCKVHPRDGSLYVALTYNTLHGNLFGQIIRLLEDEDNPEGESFRFEIFLAGGPQSGLACPDNLTFDRHGNLWVICDMDSTKLNKGPFKPFGNNGVYVVPTSGPSTGDAFQFASGPVECEMTGPCFNEEEGTLFISVQHPGEESPSLEELTSHWPAGGRAIPRPAVVAITGFPALGKTPVSPSR
jgi:secreted PhoX family phosphatase